MSDDGRRAVGDAEQDRLTRRATERATRRAQHETGDDVAVAPPEQLGDRPAHRVADGDHRADAEHVDERGDVVGAVGEAERLVRPQAAPVAAVVEGDDVEVPRRGRGSRRPS